MDKSKDVLQEQIQNVEVLQEQIQDAKEEAAIQNQVTREFLEEKAGTRKDNGPVDDDTSRLKDNQNRLTSVHNRRLE
ncbi:hypothetical protein [Paenibacillus wynnii]|uniref:hypothetical protein n=1 Tax=Paenibacillus wynnii TaxID=268407 RepID=UPI00278E919A|nr:hypothetical protein [Paenibacillus wynnii]MDQ0192931.1 hypothetical protein [Paenibacillus wynnii]